MQCVIKGCRHEAEYDVPTLLCEQHWQMWFDFKLEIPERMKIKNIRGK